MDFFSLNLLPTRLKKFFALNNGNKNSVETVQQVDKE